MDKEATMSKARDHIDEAQETLDVLRALRGLLKPGDHGGHGLTLAEVAKALNVSEFTVRSWTGTYHAKEKAFRLGSRFPMGARDEALKRFVAKKYAAWHKEFVRTHPEAVAAAKAVAASSL